MTDKAAAIRLASGVAALGLFTLLPVVLDAYQLHWAITILLYVTLALAWDALARTGQVSFGHAGFFGLGAYAAVLAASAWELQQIVAILFAGVAVGCVAVVGSLLFLRVRGIYFAILTLALSEVFKVGATMFESVTGGAMGLSATPMFGGSAIRSYFFLLAIATLCVAAVYGLQRSRLHFGITAVRSNPDVAAAFGVPVRSIRICAFTGSAAVTGMMGGFYAFYTTYINPESAFDGAISVAPVIMSIFGGLYTIAGPVIGAASLTLVQEYLRTTFEYGSLVIYGILLVVSILFMPNGVWGLLRKSHIGRALSGPITPDEPQPADAANP